MKRVFAIIVLTAIVFFLSAVLIMQNRGANVKRAYAVIINPKRREDDEEANSIRAALDELLQ